MLTLGFLWCKVRQEIGTGKSQGGTQTGGKTGAWAGLAPDLRAVT